MEPFHIQSTQIPGSAVPSRGIAERSNAGGGAGPAGPAPPAAPVAPDAPALSNYFAEILARAPPLEDGAVPSPADVQMALFGQYMQQQAAAAAAAAAQSKKVKPFSLKRLAATEKETKELKDDLIYIHWVPTAQEDIYAAGALEVIERRSVGASDPEWYEHANHLTFNAIFKAIQHSPGLNEAVLPLLGQEDSAFDAWEAIRNHFVRKIQWAKVEFKRELSSFRHKTGEDMTSFLSRMETIRLKAQTYGYRITDGECVMALVPVIDRSWGDKVCMYFPPDTDFDDMDWPTVKAALAREDRERRGSVKNPNLLPLGWVSRQGGARAAAGDQAQGAALPVPQAAPEKGQSRFQNTRPAGGPRSPPKSWQQIQCCWFCKKIGHSVRDCRNKGKPAFYQVTLQDREVCDKKKQQHFHAMQNRSPKVSAALPAETISPPTPQPASPEYTAGPSGTPVL